METVEYPFKKRICYKCKVEDYEKYMYRHGAIWYCPHCETGYIKFKRIFLFLLIIVMLIIAFARQCSSADQPTIYYAKADRMTMWQSGFKRINDPSGGISWIGTMKCYDKTGTYTGTSEIIILDTPRYDVNTNGKTNVQDLTLLVTYMFRSL